MRLVAIIPARGGSKRIPRKNIREFMGKPVIAYSIEAALSFDALVYVSTDDAEIAFVAREFGASVIERPAELADDRTGTPEVMAHAVKRLGRGLLEIHKVACIYPCAPLIDAGELMRGHGYILQDDVHYAFSIGTDPLRDAGQWYWATARTWERQEPIFSPRSRMIPVRYAIDINTEADWQLALCTAMGLVHAAG